MDYLKQFEVAITAMPVGFRPKEMLYRFKRNKYDQLKSWLLAQIAKGKVKYYSINNRDHSIELQIKAVTITIELIH